MKEILTQIKKYIPSSWPLQSFIAVNPLFDLTEQPIDSVIAKIQQYTNIKGTLSLREYHEYYRTGKITLHDLDFALREFLDDKKLPANGKGPLMNCLTNPGFQSEIEEDYDSRGNSPVKLIAARALLHGVSINDIKQKVVSFCNDFFDLGQAKWQMPINETNLFKAWLKYVVVEKQKSCHLFAKISTNSEPALVDLLTGLGIPPSEWHDYLITVAFQILGWSSFVKWLESRPDNPYFDKNACVGDLLAIWLGYELLLQDKYHIKYSKVQLPSSMQSLCHLGEKYNLPDSIGRELNQLCLGLIWQRAYEYSYQEELVNLIKSNHSIYSGQNTIKAQAVFCIDTRSEGIRRHLESLGNYQTYGFAGFFGVGFKLDNPEQGTCTLQCPAIVVPDKTLIAKPVRQSLFQSCRNALAEVIAKAKHGFFSPFVLFDAVGIWFSSRLVGKTIYPGLSLGSPGAERQARHTNLTVDLFSAPEGFTYEEMAEKIAFVLKAIGLTAYFAPFVIIAGHQAESENNPFQSSLDCGACGGNGGIANAIAFCQAANNDKVRELLCDHYSINVPEGTVFISSCHFTTSDYFEYYNLETLADTAKKIQFDEIKLEIDHACNLLRNERIANLYGEENVQIRKTNWAELIPETALANNAAFIIGPRSISAGLHLQRRAFLHSYDPETDPDGTILSFIFNAPLLVGHWINSQYYFSSTDPDIYGSGNKAIHNVVGGFGVMEGNFSDYKIGLPVQSLRCLDQKVHEPLRLLVIVYAKHEIVDKILSGSPLIANLFTGRWAHLQVIEPEYNLNKDPA